jgi:hypothetical protein
MDVERLKNPQPIFGQDYFKEQLEKIRDIRSSKRRFYQQLLTFMPSVALIMITIRKPQKSFSQLCKTNCIGQLLVKQLPK